MKVIGLMSGTSGDGVDAALVEITGSGLRLNIRLLAFLATPYPPDLQRRVLALASGGDVAEVCHLNVVLGEWFAKAARRLLHKAGLSPSRVALFRASLGIRDQFSSTRQPLDDNRLVRHGRSVSN